MVLAVITTLITHHRTDKITKLLLTTGMRHRRLAKDRTSVITLSVPEMVVRVIRWVLRHRALVRRLLHSNVLRSHRLQDQLALHRAIRQLQLLLIGIRHRHHATRQLQPHIEVRLQRRAIRQLQPHIEVRLLCRTIMLLRLTTMVLLLVRQFVRELCITLIRLSFLTDILRSCTTTADRIVRPCTRMLTIS